MIRPEETLKHIGTPECHRFRLSVFSRHRPLSFALSADYFRESKKNGYIEANRRLGELDRSLFLGDKNSRLHASSPDKVVKEWAEARAHEADLIFTDVMGWGDNKRAFKEMKEFVERNGLEFPLVLKQNMTEREELEAHCQAVARSVCPKWWRKQARKVLYRKLETVARDIRIVSAEKQLYCSDINVANRKRQKQRNRELLESLEAENQDGDVYTLAELAELGLANPKNRFAELITRSKGNDELAEMFGHEGLFITLTTPSRFHRMSKGNKSCWANSKWDGSTPRDGQDWLCDVWEKVRAKYGREGIRFYGFRVVEPHHDGTPHWHMALFFNPEDVDKARAIFRQWALKDSPGEKGAQEQRFDSKDIDPEQGATAYLVKYLTKNIDGAEGMEDELDLESNTVQEDMFVKNSQPRVEAWATCWGIRQFQFLGGPSVTVWRELRKVKGDYIHKVAECLTEESTEKEMQTADLEGIHEAADWGDWAAFVLLMGGVMIPKAEYKLQPWKITKEEENAYFETVEQIKGICEGVRKVITRVNEWVVRRVQRAEEKEAHRADSWTCVNNCTEPATGRYLH